MNQRPARNGLIRKAGTIACLLAVLATLGGHWMALQSVAWVRMISQYSRQGSLASALCKTFDGRHPCDLCRSIQHGRQQEQKEHQDLPSVRLGETVDLLCDLRQPSVPLPPLAATPAVPFVPDCHDALPAPPQAPPPRA